MHIGILLAGHVAEALTPDYGDYDAMFESLLDGYGFTFTCYPVVDMEFPARPEAADGWLITGSRHGVYEDHTWLQPLEDLIRATFDARVPMAGICFGHQIIAQALGGKVEKFSGGWAVGRQVYDFDDHGPLSLNAWHQDQVVSIPGGAKVIARNPFCRIAALTYGDRVFTVQAHPEFRCDFLKDLITVRGRGIVPDNLLDEATGKLGEPLDSPVLANRIGEFFITAGNSHA